MSWKLLLNGDNLGNVDSNHHHRKSEAWYVISNFKVSV